MYFASSFLIIASISLYYLLRRTDVKLIWLAIPIALILFNAGQSDCFLWGICGISWFTASASIFLAIFFISKIENSRFAIVFAIVFSVIASFTIIHGLLFWIVGGFGLLFLQNKKKNSLIIWSLSALAVYLIYFTNYTRGTFKGIQYDTLFTVEGIEYILLFLSNGLIVHLREFYPIQITISIIIIMIIIGGPIYLKIKKRLDNKMIPWVQIGMFGLLGAVITELGRLGVVGPVAGRYIALAAFAQIACLVIGTILFLDFYNKLKDKRKRIFAKIIFIIIMIFLITGIGSSYYSGWKIGEDFSQRWEASYECLRDPTFELKCRGIFNTEEQYNNLKILKELQLATFSKEINEYVDPLLEDKNWADMQFTKNGIGEIEYIDNNPFTKEFYIPSDTKIFVDREESPIDIGGWGIFTEKNVTVDSAVVFIDEKVNSKAHIGFLNLNYETYEGKTEPSFFAGIGGIIDLQKLSDGCHTISIRIINDVNYYIINTDSQICVK